jgi:hypothetical protein
MNPMTLNRKKAKAEPKVTFSLRITRRTRFALIVQLRKKCRIDFDKSAHVESMVQAVLSGDKEAIEAFALPILDELWHPSQWVRLRNLQKHDPDLLTHWEARALGELRFAEPSEINDEYWAPIAERYSIDI